MNLADRIVALGVGVVRTVGEPAIYKYYDEMLADEFTHSWEVAGALIEKYLVKFPGSTLFLDFYGGGNFQCTPTGVDVQIDNDSLPHAIILACVEALE